MFDAGNNLSGFASQFATQNIHSCNANLAPSAKNRDKFLRLSRGSTGGRQLDYARSINAYSAAAWVSCTPCRLRGFVYVLKIVRKTAAQQRDVSVLHPLNPLKFLRNCAWSSFHYREFLKTTLKSSPSLSCIKGLNKSEM